MIDLSLDDLFGDILIENGDLVLVSGEDELRQAVAVSLRTWTDEWFLDHREGADYPGRIFGRTDPAIRDAEIRRVLRSVDGMVTISEYQATVDAGARALSVSATLGSSEGDITIDETLEV
jgi:hypothetical protein